MTINNYNAEACIADNTVIAYINGKAIVETEWGDLYYVEMPDEFVSLGDIIPMSYLDNFENLPPDEQNHIKEVLKIDEEL